MKISLFIADFGGGGAERVFATLAKEFSERGNDVDLVIGNTNNAVNLHLISKHVRVVDLKVSRMATSLFVLMDYLRKRKPDVVLATQVHSCCFLVLAKIFSGVKTVIVLREANTISSDLRKYSWKRRLLLYLSVKILYPLADAIIGVSGGVKSDIMQFLRISDRKVHVVYSPIITEDLLRNASETCGHPWFQHGSVPVILSVGRLTQQKRFDVLIKAFSIVRKRRDVRLLILGEGEGRAKLESLVVTLNLQGDVDCPGFDPNPFKYMARARLFVLSSDWEGLPGALIQALACGCPVISTDCLSGPREILKDGRLGKLVPVGDVEAVALAIEESLMQDAVRIDEEDLCAYTAKSSTDNYLRVFNIAREA